MIDFPNGKINLGLHVTSKRQDGFHNLESIFYPVKVNDALEIIVKPGSGKVNFQTEGLPIGGDVENNLIVKAVKNFGVKTFDYEIFLLKKIPMGGGLGGGSSNGTFTLKLLQKLNALQTNVNLFEASMSLGSDCGFFVSNKPSLVKGRGEIVSEIPLDLKGYYLKLVFPKVHVSTKVAFGKIKPVNRSIDFKKVVSQPPIQWSELLINDFEKGVVNEFPQLKNIQRNLINHGADYAAMSGSGSSFYGIYNSEKVFEQATEFEEFNMPL